MTKTNGNDNSMTILSSEIAAGEPSLSIAAHASAQQRPQEQEASSPTFDVLQLKNVTRRICKSPTIMAMIDNSNCSIDSNIPALVMLPFLPNSLSKFL